MGIVVHVEATDDPSTSTVSVTGNVMHVITSQDRTTFDIQDSNLKRAWDVAHGKSPNDVYVCRPDPWDAYEANGRPEVRTWMVPVDSEILEITSEPTILKTTTLTNDSSQSGTFGVSIYDEVSNSSTSGWSSNHSFSFGQTIEYKLGFLGTGIGGETSMGYTGDWGESHEESVSYTVGSEQGLTVDLDPGESVIVKLGASRGVMRIRVKYRAYLSDQSLANYDKKFEDHHFWFGDINWLMGSIGLEKDKYDEEEMEIGYYSDSYVTMEDAKTGKELKRVHLSRMAVPGKKGKKS